MNTLAELLIDLPFVPAVLLKATALLALAWLVHFALHDRNPRWRVVLWRGTIVGLIALPIAEWTLPALEIALRPPAAETPAPLPAFQASVPSPAFDFEPVFESVPGAPAEFVAPEPAAPLFSVQDWFIEHRYALVTALWALVALAFLAMTIRAWVRVRRAIRQTTPAPDGVVRCALRTAHTLGIRRRFDVRLLRVLGSPFLTGVWRALIVLPTRAAEKEDSLQLRAVFAHELAHAKTNDPFWMAFARVVTALFWFHPLVWRVRAVHSAACEEVCDGVAAAHMGSAESYSKALAREALALIDANPVPGGVPMVRTARIVQRLRKIQRGIGANPLARRAVAATLLAGAVLFVTLGSLRLVRAQQDQDVTEEYPHAIEFETYQPDWATFQEGDAIEILEVRGTAPTFEVGERYYVRGRYTLASRDAGLLHVYATNGETQSDQGPPVAKGTSEFTRTFTLLEQGMLHVNYYPVGGGDGFGGTYFRMRRNEAASSDPAVDHAAALRDEPWWPRFEETYGLDRGEAIRYIPPPRIPEVEHFLERRGGGGKIPDVMVVYWDARHGSARSGADRAENARLAPYRDTPLQVNYRFSYLSKGGKLLKSIPAFLTEVTAAVVRVSEPLGSFLFEGDWSVAEDASLEEKLTDLERIFSEQAGRPVDIERRDVEQVVVTATGTFSYTRLPDRPSPMENEPRPVFIYHTEPGGNRAAYTSGIALEDLFRLFSQNTDVSVINRVTEPSGLMFQGTYIMPDARMEPGEAETPEGAEKLRTILTNLARQTGIQFETGRRMQTMWYITAEGEEIRSDGFDTAQAPQSPSESEGKPGSTESTPEALKFEDIIVGKWVGGGFLYSVRHEFSADGTYLQVTGTGADIERSEGTWSVDGDRLIRSSDDGKYVAEVLHFDRDSFQLEYEDSRTATYHRAKTQIETFTASLPEEMPENPGPETLYMADVVLTLDDGWGERTVLSARTGQMPKDPDIEPFILHMQNLTIVTPGGGGTVRVDRGELNFKTGQIRLTGGELSQRGIPAEEEKHRALAGTVAALSRSVDGADVERVVSVISDRLDAGHTATYQRADQLRFDTMRGLPQGLLHFTNVKFNVPYGAGTAVVTAASAEIPDRNATIADLEDFTIETPFGTIRGERGQLNTKTGEWRFTDDSGSSPAFTGFHRKLMRPFSLEVKDSHISTVLENITDEFDINITLDNRVVRPVDASEIDLDAAYVTDGKLQNVSIQNTNLDHGLRTIIRPLGLGFRTVDDGFIWISTPQNLWHETFEDLETRFYDLNDQLTDATSGSRGRHFRDFVAFMQQSIPEVLEPRTRRALSFIRFNEESNQLIAHTTPERYRQIERILAMLETQDDAASEQPDAEPAAAPDTGTITGILKVGGEPMPHTNVILTPQFEGSTASKFIETDENGRFEFAGLEPGWYHVGLFKEYVVRAKGWHSPTSTSSHIRYVYLEPGETADVEIGGKGRRVVGQLVAPEDAPIEVGWQSEDLRRMSTDSSWRERPPEGLSREERAAWSEAYRSTPDYIAQHEESTMFIVDLEADGSFSVDDVPPGDYRVHIDVGDANRERLGMAAGSANQLITVPDGEYGSIHDVGAIPIEIFDRLDPGEPAPDFTAATIDGSAINLSDFRGKYVLLTFWYTRHEEEWSDSAVQTPHLKAVYETYSDNDAFAMIGLSLDDSINEPRRYAREHDLAWIQAFDGPWAESGVVESFHVRAVPTTMLIGPDGKVIANDLRGSEIVASVADLGLTANQTVTISNVENGNQQPNADAQAAAAPAMSLNKPDEVAEAILQRQDPALRDQALDVVRQALSERESPSETRRALEALHQSLPAKFDRSPFRELALPLLESESDQIRRLALMCLPGLECTVENLDAVIPLADDPKPRVRAEAGRALILIGNGDAPDKVIPALTRLLQDDDPQVTVRTLRSMWGEYSSPEFDALLIDLSRDEEYRGYVIYHALSTMKPKSVPVVRRLIDELDEPDWNDSGRAAWGLTYGVPDAANAELEAALLRAIPEETNEYVRVKEFIALTKVATEESRPFLESVVGSSLETDKDRERALDILNQLDAAAALEREKQNPPTAKARATGEDAWRARFNEVYRLDDEAVLKLIAAPYIPERMDFYRTEIASPRRNLTDPPAVLVFHWENALDHYASNFGGGLSVEWVIKLALGIGRDRVEGPRHILDRDVLGDWVVRTTADDQALFDALADIVREELDLNVRFQPRREKRVVVVVSGTFAFTPLEQAPFRRESIHIVSDKFSGVGSGGGGGDFEKFLHHVGDLTNVQFLNETANTDRFGDRNWKNHRTQELGLLDSSSEEKRVKLEQLVANLHKQTGLDYMIEEREVDFWEVVDNG